MKKLITIGLVCMFLFQGCASMLALHSSNTKGQFVTGMTLSDAVGQGLKPLRCDVKEGQTECFFKIKANDESSLSRAGLHLVGDVFTLFWWEIPALVYEVNHGNTYIIKALFDRDGKLTKTCLIY